MTKYVKITMDKKERRLKYLIFQKINMGIGLSVAGGGLKGVAHIGVIKALKELGIEIDAIAGTSSGSLIAALYVAGFSEDEMEEAFGKNYKILTTFEKRPIAKSIGKFIIKKEFDMEGLSNGEKIENLVNKIVGSHGLTKLQDSKIPVAITTVDTVSMKECIFLSKNFGLKDTEKIDYIYDDIEIGKAVRASMSFPGIFTTCNFGKYNFIDGGTKDNLPVQVLKDIGIDKVIGASFNLDNYTPSGKIFDVIIRAVDIFSLKDVEKAREIADVSIVIETGDTSLLEISNMKSVIQAGYEETMKHKEELLKLK